MHYESLSLCLGVRMFSNWKVPNSHDPDSFNEYFFYLSVLPDNFMCDPDLKCLYNPT